MKTTEKTTLDSTSYKSVLSMLNSKDEADVALGLATIEETDRKKGMVYILLLKKKANITAEAWKDHAPKTYAWLKKVGCDPEKVIIFKKIMQILIEEKVDESQIKFFLDELGAHLHKQIVDMGYNFVDGIEIKLKIKEDGQITTTG